MVLAIEFGVELIRTKFGTSSLGAHEVKHIWAAFNNASNAGAFLPFALVVATFLALSIKTSRTKQTESYTHGWLYRCDVTAYCQSRPGYVESTKDSFHAHGTLWSHLVSSRVETPQEPP